MPTKNHVPPTHNLADNCLTIQHRPSNAAAALKSCDWSNTIDNEAIIQKAINELDAALLADSTRTACKPP